MKLFFSLVFSLVLLNSSAQNCSDSVAVSICTSSGMSGTDTYKRVQYFDSSRNRTYSGTYKEEGSGWRKFYGELYTYIYDSTGNIVDYLYQSTSGYQAPENEINETFEFDSASNLIEHASYMWSAGAWNKYTRYSYCPDTAGNDTLTLLETGFNGNWQNSERTYSEFNSDHFSVHDSAQKWNTSTLQWWLYQEIFRFYNGTEIDSMVHLLYSSSGNIINQYYTLFDFDSATMAKIEVLYSWDGVQWIYGGVDSTFYDQWGHIIASNDGGGDHYTYQYDSLGNLLVETYQGAGASSGITNYFYVNGVLRASNGNYSTQGGFSGSSSCNYRYADIDGSIFLCGYASVQLTAQPCTPGNQYLWSTGETTTTISADTSDSYEVTVTYPSGFIDSSFTFQVVASPPVLMSLPDDTTLCTTENILLTAGSSFYTYLWQDSSMTSSFLATSLVPDTILYSLWITDSIGCAAADTIQIIFDACAGVSYLNGKNFDLVIFPNPATHQFSVTSKPLIHGRLEIFNSIGEKIYSEYFHGLSTIDCMHFPGGIYFVRVNDNEKYIIQKLIIE